MAGVPEGFKRINFNARTALAERLDAESARSGHSKARILTLALEAWLHRDIAPSGPADEALPSPVARELEVLQEGLRQDSMQRSLQRLEEIAAEAARRQQSDSETVTLPAIGPTPGTEEEAIDPRLA